MAFTKQQKDKMVALYREWLRNAQGVVLVTFNKMSMKEIDTLRTKIRDAGGEAHVVKNTLFYNALSAEGIHVAEKPEGTTLAVFSSDPASIAKALVEALGKSEIFQIKGGFLGTELLNAAQVKSLAALPPLPVMRARLLGVLVAPASQLVRTLAEPARSMAAVIKAHSEKEAVPAAG
ncbi:MAG TPA: 50S ribosomal protein L10 [Anaerolineaceae bacterium]|nr:50S ribosomal protein L10 [Longilinea sp.]HNR46924.1 50S ribosomal protein L10 [Anaerolineaceae bacterium]HNZ12854.1 50S ribosomal protein L10 [Anaerolineaceae bacterium]HOD04070.1 50S ribosomal protein L10 [Anaerolineaceae bacterium]HOG78906.1 50S ribosomal protein L10 [Anaerolineaceae bacterium]